MFCSRSQWQYRTRLAVMTELMGHRPTHHGILLGSQALTLNAVKIRSEERLTKSATILAAVASLP